MPNPIKYTTGSETLALKKGNFYIGTGDVGKGPSDTTGFYQGVSPSSGGYVIYMNKSGAPGDLSYHNAANDSELISFTNSIAGTSYTTANECLVYFASQTDKVVLNRDYEGIVTDGLVLNLDAGFTPSYPKNGTTWYDVSLSGNNGTLINGPTFSTDGGGSIVFDGVDDYSRIEFNTLFNGSSSDSFSIEIIFKRNSLVYGNADSLYQMGTGGLTNARIYFWFDNNSNGSMSINYYTQSGVLNGDRYVVLDSQLDDLNYHHAVQIVNKETSLMTGYWDGINKGSGGIISNSFTSDVYFDIAGPNYCDATIGIVRIYNRALTSDEVLQNYNAQKGRFGL